MRSCDGYATNAAQPAKNSETDAAKSDFIAAARRAAQAAAAEAEIMKRHPDIAGPVRNMKLGKLFSAKRKPLLMAGVAILVALAGLQLSKAFLTDDSEIASGQQALDAEQSAAPVAEQSRWPQLPTRQKRPPPTEPPADDANCGRATGRTARSESGATKSRSRTIASPKPAWPQCRRAMQRP